MFSASIRFGRLTLRAQHLITYRNNRGQVVRNDLTYDFYKPALVWWLTVLVMNWDLSISGYPESRGFRIKWRGHILLELR